MRAMRQLNDVVEVLQREEFSQSMYLYHRHGVEVLIVRRETLPHTLNSSGGRISHGPFRDCPVS